MNFRNKKGDLNLSINAIVVLIIAIVFLGLALTFTRNIIGGSSKKLLAGVDQVDLQNPANADRVITFDSEFKIKAGDEKIMKMSVYNKNSSSVTGSPGVIACINENGASASPINITAISGTIPSNSESRFQILVEGTGSTGDYNCKIGVGNIVTQVPVKITG